MDWLTSFSKTWLPAVAVVLVTAGAWWLVQHITTRDPDRREELDVRRQLLLVAVVIVGTVALVLTLPVDLQLKGALLGVLGLTLAAIIGLSATSMVGNALAGLMLRSVGNFRPGDFLSVEGHFGRVTYRRLLATEIQTEDRDLTTLPNNYLATRPVKVVRASGTVVSATVSIGYDVHRLQLEPLFEAAALGAGLTSPFTHVVELGDYSVTYRIAGFLDEVKQLLSVRSALRAAIFDQLSDAGIEIMSPTIMGQRPVDGKLVAARPAATSITVPAGEPDERIFDKAEAAAALEEGRVELDTTRARLEELEEARRSASAEEASTIDTIIAAARERIAELEEGLAAPPEQD